MAELKLKYPEYLNIKFIKKSLENGLCCSDTKVNEFEITNLIAGAGENYCSDIYQVIVRYQLSDADQELEENFVIKSMPKHKQNVLKSLKIYARELYFYRNILPKMETFMNIREKQWILGPKLFYNIADPVETLVFQNLTPIGFKLQSRQKGLDKVHSLMVLQKLAQYHALSMTLINYDDDIFTNVLQRYPYGLLNMDSCKSASFKALFGAQLLKLIDLLKEDSEFLDVFQKLQKYYEHFTERVLKSVYPLRGQLNVLNHGDLWVNNLMFRYESDNELKPKEVRFIDFQLSFYGSLGYDINYFLNTSVQLEVLQNNRHELIDFYTTTLQQTLDKLPYSSTAALPTKKEILQEIYDREAYGFFISFGLFPLMSMSTADSEDNSLDNLNDPEFAQQKIQLMFTSNNRTIETLKFNIKRLEQLGVL